MMYTFKSCFASQIEDFIAQKNALGFGYLESSRLLRDFDRFCLTHFQEENTLTKELCLAWATKKDTEGNNTFRNRMMPVREFARYLNRNGEAAYILPPDIARKDAPYAPYIYTEAEIQAIWNVLDALKPRRGFPVRHFVIPAMVKLLYCCGLRPAEVRRLRVRDVDLDKGRLNIMESKQHRSRIVMMADDVVENFYVQADFDVDAAFGTFVCTDENDDWLNIYANYDIVRDRPCDTLELNLCKGDGTEEYWSYHLNAAEQEMLARKMEAFCQQQNGMSLHDFARRLQEEPGPSPQIQM